MNKSIIFVSSLVFFAYTFLAIISLILAFFLEEPPFHQMSFNIFKSKIKKSITLIKTNKLYYLLLVLIFARGAPSLIETSEYYFTLQLKFTSFLFSLKNILMTLAIVIAILMIKYNVFNYYSKRIISLVNFIVISSTLILCLILLDIIKLPKSTKTILAFLKATLYNFGVESLVIILFNIYITFCPKDIEGTFSTFYLSINYLSVEISELLENFILYLGNINGKNNFKNVFWLLMMNLLILLLVYVWITLMVIPDKESLNKDESIIEIDTEREFFYDETLDHSRGSLRLFSRRYLPLHED